MIRIYLLLLIVMVIKTRAVLYLLSANIIPVTDNNFPNNAQILLRNLC